MQKNKKGEVEIKILIVKELAALVHEYNIDFNGSISQTAKRFISQGNLYNKGARYFLDLILEHTSEIILEPKGGKYGYKVLYNTKDPAIIKDIDFFFGTPYYSNILKNILKEKERIANLERREKDLERREKKLSRTGVSIVSRSLADQFLNHKKTISQAEKLDGSLAELNKFEIKIITAIVEILNDQSSTDLKEEDSFTGLSFTSEEGRKSPEVYISLYEIAKKITNKENPSGGDIQSIEKTINDLSTLPEKRFKFKYETKSINPKTGKIEFYEISTTNHLFQKLDIESFIEKNGVRISQGKAVCLALHNVFINQIQESFIKIPKIKDTITMAGTSDLSEIIQKLIYEISYAHSNKYFCKKENESSIYTIGEKNLFDKIAPKQMLKRQKSRVIPYFEKGLAMIKGLGMVTDFTQSKGVKGDILYNFHLHKEGWNKN